MTTTETLSVDEARLAYESAVQHAQAVALDNMDKADGDRHGERHDEAECRAFVDSAFDRLAAAVRAEAIRERDAMERRADAAESDWQEAIRERDEAIGLLRARDVDPDVTAVEWISALAADVREALGRDEWEHDDPESMRECLTNIDQFVKRARAFISRFPEGGEG